MNPVPHSKRLSDFPYLLAAVLHVAVERGDSPSVAQQKAHRLINKHAYKTSVLDVMARRCWIESINDWLNSESTMPLVDTLAFDRENRVVNALDQKDADYGNLHDFISHVFSQDE